MESFDWKCKWWNQRFNHMTCILNFCMVRMVNGLSMNRRYFHFCLSFFVHSFSHCINIFSQHRFQWKYNAICLSKTQISGKLKVNWYLDSRERGVKKTFERSPIREECNAEASFPRVWTSCRPSVIAKTYNKENKDSIHEMMFPIYKKSILRCNVTLFYLYLNNM